MTTQHCFCACEVSIHLRVSIVAELPGLGHGGEGSEVKGQMLAHQFAVHLFGWTNDAGPPLKRG